MLPVLRLLPVAGLLLVVVPLHAQTTGTCAPATATVDLDVNNVRARLYNMGGLFWKGAGNVYNVPKALPGQPISPNAIFAAGIWMGGTVGGQLRMGAATYSDWEFWPGPLDASGNLPGDGDCSRYDRMWSIYRADLERYDETGAATDDLREWPWEIGAPVKDGDGNPNNYNLAGGDRPDLIGDQMVWWVMNDVGNVHQSVGTPPMGLEVQGTAFSFDQTGIVDIGHLDNTTFYRYKLLYKGQTPLTNAWFGIWSDTDLGNASDDFVGTDTTLGLAFFYNADNFDDGADGYGDDPPAQGYDFLQGPTALPDGRDNDRDGLIDEPGERHPMTRTIYYSGDASVIGNPRNNTLDYYQYLQGIWADGRRMCHGGVGHPTLSPPGTCTGVADFMFPGDPVTAQFWSERNADGAGGPNVPSDRRFLMSTGPFEMQPGQTEEILFAIVWARGTDHLDSLVRLREASRAMQSAYDAGFRVPVPPDAPEVSVSEVDGGVILSWSNPPGSNNHAEGYTAEDILLDPVLDRTYRFEGYKVWQYPDARLDPAQARLIASFDVKNEVKEVWEGERQTYRQTAFGTDSGVQQSLMLDSLTNYGTYHYGVQAYSYNAQANPKVLDSPVTTVTVVPSRPDARNGGTTVRLDALNALLPVERQTLGEGGVAAQVVDPARITGDDYEVRFYDFAIPAAHNGVACVRADTVVTYDLVNATRGEVLLDGRVYACQFGEGAPQRDNVATYDGIQFSVTGPAAGINPTFPIKRFITVANAAGPLNPPETAAFAFNSSGFPTIDGGTAGNPYLNCFNDRPDGARQQSTVALAPCGAGWGFQTYGGFITFPDWLSRTVTSRGNLPFVGANDFEMRFTTSGSLGLRAVEDGVAYRVSFELWNLGPTPEDPADDVRMIPWMCEAACGAGRNPLMYDIGGDSPLSGGTNDPIADAVYWMQPRDATPGQTGYQAYEAAVLAGTYDYADEEVIARTVLMCWNCGTAPPYPQTHPEVGTVFRIETYKPNLPGDVFTIHTADYAVQQNQADVARRALDNLYITPNPYLGVSTYEVSNRADVARFTNLPPRCTIRVFTLGGTLVRLIEKDDPSIHLDWDLRNDHGLDIGSGMFLIHVTVPGVGEKVIKFGVVKKKRLVAGS
jgi:hypothetical protein